MAATGLDREILDRARDFEPERYLSALLAPKEIRSDLVALAAFAADLARIPATVTEPMMGEMRLQWWRDQFGPLSEGSSTSHPVADALGAAIRRHHLPLPLLTAMTEARAFDLYADPLPDDAALDGYLGKTEAIPFELGLRIAGVPDDAAGRLAAAAGRSFGLARLAAALPGFWAAGRPVLPENWFAAATTASERQLTRSDMTGAGRLVEIVISRSNAAAATVEPQIALLSRPQRTVLLPLAARSLHATAARSEVASGLRQRHPVSPLRRIVRLGLAHMLGKL